MPNPFAVLGDALTGGAAIVAGDVRLASPRSAPLVADAPELAAGAEGSAILALRGRGAVVAARLRDGLAAEVIVAAGSAPEVPLAPLVETGLMGATTDDAVAPVAVSVPSGVLALVVARDGAPRVAPIDAEARLVRVAPGEWVARVARLALPRGAAITAWVLAPRR